MTYHIVDKKGQQEQVLEEEDDDDQEEPPEDQELGEIQEEKISAEDH